MRSAISPSLNVKRIRRIASALCFVMLFAAEARTVFACTSTSLNVYADSSYVYADASVSTGQCGSGSI